MSEAIGSEVPRTIEGSLSTPEVSPEGINSVLTDVALDLVESEAAVMRAQEIPSKHSIHKMGRIEITQADAQQSQVRADRTTAVLSRVFNDPDTPWAQQIADRVKAIKQERALKALASGRNTPWYR